MSEGRQSPPPERQSGAQQQSPPAHGQGVDKTEKKGEKVKSELDNLSSNPKGPMDDALKDKFAKTESK